VADVGRQRVHPPLAAIESKGEVAAVGEPEVLVEPLPELRGLLFEPVGQFDVAPEAACQPRTTHLRVIDVALDLAARAGQARLRAVRKEDRVV
jgi:hypothetical protein